MKRIMKEDNQSISKIIEILKENENNLSDGFAYYCRVDKTLTNIAEKIIESITDAVYT
jgi:hypothetical protein